MGEGLVPTNLSRMHACEQATTPGGDESTRAAVRIEDHIIPPLWEAAEDQLRCENEAVLLSKVLSCTDANSREKVHDEVTAALRALAPTFSMRPDEDLGLLVGPEGREYPISTVAMVLANPPVQEILSLFDLQCTNLDAERNLMRDPAAVLLTVIPYAGALVSFFSPHALDYAALAALAEAKMSLASQVVQVLAATYILKDIAQHQIRSDDTARLTVPIPTVTAAVLLAQRLEA